MPLENWGKRKKDRFSAEKKKKGDRELIRISLEKELAVVCRPLIEKSGGMMVRRTRNYL